MCVSVCARPSSSQLAHASLLHVLLQGLVEHRVHDAQDRDDAADDRAHLWQRAMMGEATEGRIEGRVDLCEARQTEDRKQVPQPNGGRVFKQGNS